VSLTFKLPALILLLMIIFALGEAMYYLSKDHGDKDKTRVVKALSMRVTLALVLFILLIVGAFFGFIQPPIP
jgi:putative copper export protein